MATHSSILTWRIPWRAAWWATVHRVAKSWTRLKRFIITWFTLSTFKCLINVKLKMNNLVVYIAKAS